MTPAPHQRPKYYDLNLAHLPAPGLVSIFHRVSGAVLFFPVIPLLLLALQASLGSESGYLAAKKLFAEPAVKAIAIALAWLYAHHFYAGLRYLLLDVHVGVAKDAARASAKAVFVLGALTALLFAWRIW